MPAKPVIEVRDLVRRFGSTVALDRLSLTIQQGEIFGVLGHNGAGKTTLIRLINGLLRPTSGEVRTFGEAAYEAGARIRVRTGVVTESTALDDFLSIRESLISYGLLAGMHRDRIDVRVDELLGIFGLVDVADHQVRELSAGMRQRAAFARGLVHEPQLLLLDEPTANMDPVAARQVRDIVTGLARETGSTVVISTHNLAEAQGVCDRIAVLQHGRLQALGTMDELGALTGRDGREVRITTDASSAETAVGIAGTFGDASIDGRADVVVLRRVAADAVPDLVVALVRGGVPIRDIRQLQPTLEDVYMSLHERTDA